MSSSKLLASGMCCAAFLLLFAPGSSRGQDCGDPCQLPDQSGGVVSAPAYNISSADSFVVPYSGSINSVCWWGGADNLWDGNQFAKLLSDCSTTLEDVFTITYFNDNASGPWPGTVKAGPYNVSASRMATGNTILDLAEYKWSTFHSPVAVEENERLWIEIKNFGFCALVWGKSNVGDGRYCYFNYSYGHWTCPSSEGDLAFCVYISDCVFSTIVGGTATYTRPRDAHTMLRRLYRSRDGFMRASPVGRRWTSLFYMHSATASHIVRENPGLYRRIAVLLSILSPGLDTLNGERVEATRISPRAIALLEAVLKDFEEADVEGRLARAIRAEYEALDPVRLIGKTYLSAWEEINARAMPNLADCTPR